MRLSELKDFTDEQKKIIVHACKIFDAQDVILVEKENNLFYKKDIDIT